MLKKIRVFLATLVITAFFAFFLDVVQLLPYHTLGTVKWERLGRGGPVLEATPPSDELMNARKEQLEAMGLNVIIH